MSGQAETSRASVSGYVHMAPKAGATQFLASNAIQSSELPDRVDLRPLLTPVEDQGDTSSCVANAVAGAYEYWIKKATKTDHYISRLFVYYNARWRDNSQDKDDGCVIQLAMEGLQKFGACSEPVWPFNPHLVNKKPGADAYQDGAPHRVDDMAQVPMELEAWKQALAEGKPVVFAISLFDSFDDCKDRGGVVEMPSPHDLARKTHSEHSMCAVGYNEAEKVFIVRNSWGTDFGDNGYCYIPYDYMLNPKFNDGDNWVFIPKVDAPPPRETWTNTDEPVTNGGKGVDFDISPFKIEDYANIAVDLFEAIRQPWNGDAPKDYGTYVEKVASNLFHELDSVNFKNFLASKGVDANVIALLDLLGGPAAKAPQAKDGSDNESQDPEGADDAKAADDDTAPDSDANASTETASEETTDDDAAKDEPAEDAPADDNSSKDETSSERETAETETETSDSGASENDDVGSGETVDAEESEDDDGGGKKKRH